MDVLYLKDSRQELRELISNWDELPVEVMVRLVANKEFYKDEDSLSVREDGKTVCEFAIRENDGTFEVIDCIEGSQLVWEGRSTSKKAADSFTKKRSTPSFFESRIIR